MKYVSLFFLISFYVFIGCAPAINQKSSAMHSQSAMSAIQNDDWGAARRHWAKAVVNAELANDDSKQLAILYYEYGRSLGVTCFYEMSENYLKKALEIDKKTSGPTHMSILELARLFYSQQKYMVAISYYEKLIPIYSELNADILDPIGVADVLDEYSSALAALGKKPESDFNKQQAQKLRFNNQGKTSSTDITPYGTKCGSES